MRNPGEKKNHDCTRAAKLGTEARRLGRTETQSGRAGRIAVRRLAIVLNAIDCNELSCR